MARAELELCYGRAGRVGLTFGRPGWPSRPPVTKWQVLRQLCSKNSGPISAKNQRSRC
jgi:hypothetical protein